MSSQPTPPLAIVGVSALFPGSSDADGFWRDVLHGKDLLGPVPPQYWLTEDYYDPDPKAPDKTYVKRGAFLSPIDFDALGFGIPPSILDATDTAQLLALIVAQRVLEDATRGNFAHLDREKVSIILGVTSAQELLADMVSRLQRPVWVKALRESGIPEDEVQAACDRISSNYAPWQEATFPGLLGNVVAGRIANRLDLHGTNCVTDAACASTFAALQMGANELWLNQADMVIVGGVDTMNGIFMHMCFSKTPALSKSGDCAPFSDKADGTMLGEGMAMFALRRLEDAERDGDHVYAVLRGIGTSSDGRSKSVYAPVPEGQARCLRRAYDAAGYSPSTVELVEAHGTGTKAGDAAEFGGLKMVWDESGRADRQWCAVGSVKSQIGHTKAAAGAAGLFKAVMALRHRTLPPTIKVDRPNPALHIDESPFYLNTETRPWIRADDHPRRAGVSAFGFGGSNFHLAVEEYKGPHAAPRRRVLNTELVVLAAESPTALAAAADALASEVDVPGTLRFLAWRQAHAVHQGSSRLAVVAPDEVSLAAALRDAASRVRKAPDAAFVMPNGASYSPVSDAGEVGFLFPGQGSQYLGMGGDLAENFDAAIAVWDRAASLGLGADVPLAEVVFPRPVFDDVSREVNARRLQRTDNAQPALGAASAALLAVLTQAGVKASCAAGHSFGEVAALHAAGALDVDGFLRASAARGASMAAAATVPGAMCAVRGTLEDITEKVKRWGDDLTVANHNHPTQVVLSGATAMVEDAIAHFTAEGIDAKRLDVATAFHSPIVEGAAEAYRAALAAVDVRAPHMDVIADSDAKPYSHDPAAVRAHLAHAIAEPVRFVDVVEAMYARGVRTFVEVGPNQVLSGLVQRILGERAHRAVALDRKGKDGVTQLFSGLGELFVAGVGADLGALWRGFATPVDPRTVAKPKLAVPIAGWNVGKPYPPVGGASALPQPNGPRPEPEPLIIERIVEVPVYSPAEESMAGNDPSSGGGDTAWLAAFHEMQRQTAEAHGQWQSAMARSHEAYLATVQRGLEALAGYSGVALTAPTYAAPAPAYAPPAPVYAAPPAPAAYTAPPVYVPPPTHVPGPVVVPASQVLAPPAPAPRPAPVAAAPAPAPAPKPAAKVASAAADLSGVLLTVVAEKTGYPTEMLTMDMDLEADLGVDSIKRVEILSALREKVPGLPEVDAGAMAALQTLGQIVSALGGVAGGAAAAPAAVAPAAGGMSLTATLLAVVAEKTGYPTEMLTLDMDLEADLGVDSIKRVEILSALREKVPGLPEVDAASMAALQTLGQIVGALGDGGAVAPSASSFAPATTPNNHGIGRHVVEVVAAPASGLGVAGLTSGELHIVGGPAEVGVALVAALASVGVSSKVVSSADGTAAGLVWLGGLDAISDRARARVVSREAFLAVQPVAQKMSMEGGLLVLVQSTGGDFGVSAPNPLHAWTGGVAGIAKTAALEWPKATVKAIDVDARTMSPAQIAHAIAEELIAGGVEVEVGLGADGVRRTLKTRETASPTGALVLGNKDVVVATGGARGVTAATMIALAKASHARFVLLGRTALADEPAVCAAAKDDAALKGALLADAKARGVKVAPAELGKTVKAILAAREIRATLHAITQAGGHARYDVADVNDAEALSRVLDDVRASWGPITALVHGAGVIADRFLTDKTPEQFDSVFDTKTVGLAALLDATASDPLRAIVLFSSVAARGGNNGQSDYAAANEVLNKVARAEAARRPGCVVKSLGWGPWRGGMVNSALEARFEALGVPLIPLDVGARMLVDELREDGDGAVEIVVGTPNEGALLAEGRTHEARASVRVDAAHWPALTDHRVKGEVVVPVVMAVEWLARLASACRPDLFVADVRKVEVLAGQVVRGFEQAGLTLQGHARQLENGDGAVVLAELREAGGRVAYRAHVRLEEKRPSGAAASPAPKVTPFDDVVYDGRVVFHGRDFQVLAGTGLSADGAVAMVAGLADRGWTGGAWQTDPAALDGLLQLGVLWTERVLGGGNLPTSIESVRVWRAGPIEGALHGWLRKRDGAKDRVTYDAALVGADGRLVAELRGVTHHRLPGEAPARDWPDAAV